MNVQNEDNQYAEKSETKKWSAFLGLQSDSYDCVLTQKEVHGGREELPQ